MEETILYQKGTYGLNVWKIWSENNIIKIQANGQIYSEIIEEGKAGRTIEQQVQLRMNARINDKLDDGFVYNVNEIKNKRFNQLGLPLPMLAKQFKDAKDKINLNDCYFQPKLNGHRCIITNINDKMCAYSRRGRWISVIDHITDNLPLPEGYFLDGELYKHGIPLQTIASWVKRDVPLEQTKEIEYHVYDIFKLDKDSNFEMRINFLRDFIERIKNPSIKYTETIYMKDQKATATELLKEYKFKGFEGLILRPRTSIYRIGERPYDLVKFKERIDGEFKCLDIISSRDGWGILVLQIPWNNKTFECVAPGTIIDKIETLLNKEKYIGRFVTCEYADLTIEGKPFHCVATNWRSDL